MHRPVPIKPWSCLALSLILLTANIGAPFRSTALGRTLLSESRNHFAASPVVRVRGVSPIGAALGFRSVVGLGKGGRDAVAPGSTPGPFLTLLSPPTDTPPSLEGDRVIGRRNPPLRC